MKLRTTVVLVAAVTLAATGCAKEAKPSASAQPSVSETTLKACVIDQGFVAIADRTGKTFKTLKPGKLTVGSDTAFPPFESIAKGKAVGFDVDLITAISKRIGVPNVEIQTAAFDTIFTSLAAGKFDVVVSAVTIKADRKKTVDFTKPYFTADQSLSVRSADVGSMHGVADLKGKIVGVQSGTTGEDCAKNALKATGKVADVRSYDTAPDAFTDLSAKRVDAVLVDLPTAKQIVEQRQGVSVVQKILTSEEYGIAVAKTNPNLREAINDALAALRKDGTYRTLFVKWFKTEPPT